MFSDVRFEFSCLALLGQSHGVVAGKEQMTNTMMYMPDLRSRSFNRQTNVYFTVVHMFYRFYSFVYNYVYNVLHVLKAFYNLLFICFELLLSFYQCFAMFCYVLLSRICYVLLRFAMFVLCFAMFLLCFTMFS